MSLMPATPKATRYGDLAADLGRLNQVQASDQEWCAETTWQDNRLVVAHDPQAAARRGLARDKTIAELVQLGQQCSSKLDDQDAGRRAKGRPMSDSGTKLLLVTNTDAPAAEVVQRYKSLADIERGFRVLKSEIEIGPVHHRKPVL